MTKRRMIVVDKFSLIEQLTDLLSPSTDYVSGTGPRPGWWSLVTLSDDNGRRWLLYYFLQDINTSLQYRKEEEQAA